MPRHEPFSRQRSLLRRGRAGPQAGFTLLESMLALALVALIASVVLPRVLPNASATALRIKAFQVAALLRADRNAALRTGRTVATVIDLTARGVRSGASDGSVPLPNTFSVRLVTGVPNGFQFFPDGSSSGGELVLATAQAAVTVRVNDFTAAIRIHSGVQHGG